MPLIRKSEGGVPPQTDTAAAHAALDAPSPDDRWSAVRQLAGKPGHARALLQALDKEEVARVREAILSALAKDGGAEAIAGVVTLIRSPGAAVRTAALDALATAPAAIATNIAALLLDPDRDVRILSCDLLRRLPARQATDFLVPVLLRDSDINVCAAAVEVLSEVGDERARGALESCAARFAADDFLAYAIAVALRRIGAADRAPDIAPT